MKVLISPAKSIDVKNPYTISNYTVPVFLKETNQLITKLKKLSAKKISTMMDISKDLAEINYNRFQNWNEPLNPDEQIIPAIFAFNGEVYKGFDARSMSEDNLLLAQKEIRILSGLYGILKPLDLLYPYRLEMGTKWEITPKSKSLYQFWGKKLAVFLNNEMEKGEALINLASIEYSKAVDRKVLKARMITPIFKEFKNGEYKTIMIFAKHARGEMARYIVVNRIENPEELKLYTVGGYSYDENQSIENEWVFIR